MKEFHFAKTYFRQLVFDYPASGIRVEVDEKPSLNLSEENYSLWISTRYEDAKTMHRDYAFEHHIPPAKHDFPHLQFKFHTDEIREFRIRIDVANSEEYRRAVLGFIYKTKIIFGHLEKYHKGITARMLVLELVNKLGPEGEFLANKIREGIGKYLIEFDQELRQSEQVKKLSENPLLVEFIGKENLKIISNRNSSTRKPKTI